MEAVRVAGPSVCGMGRERLLTAAPVGTGRLKQGNNAMQAVLVLADLRQDRTAPRMRLVALADCAEPSNVADARQIVLRLARRRVDQRVEMAVRLATGNPVMTTMRQIVTDAAANVCMRDRVQWRLYAAMAFLSQEKRVKAPFPAVHCQPDAIPRPACIPEQILFPCLEVHAAMARWMPERIATEVRLAGKDVPIDACCLVRLCLIGPRHSVATVYLSKWANNARPRRQEGTV